MHPAAHFLPWNGSLQRDPRQFDGRVSPSTKGSFSMPWIRRRLGMLFVLSLAAFAAGPSTADSSSHEPLGWVRTSDGWEQAYWRRPVHQSGTPALHPAILAAFQGLFCLTVLYAGMRNHERRLIEVQVHVRHPNSRRTIRVPATYVSPGR